MPISKLILVFVFLFSFAKADEVPSRYLNGSQGFMGSALDRSCFALDIAVDTIPCNPAFIAKEKMRRFGSNIYLGNNISYLNEAMDLSKGQANEQSIQKLFSRHENNELQTQLELGFWHETFSWSVTPARVNYNSSFRNQALPEISIFAALEESAQVQFGSYFSDDWSWGVQLRYLHRRFVSSRFFLTDILLPDGKKWIEPRQQNLFFVEPAVLYAPQVSSLNPEFTIMLANTGHVSETFSEVPNTPQLHITSSISPKTTYGRYSLGVDATFDKKNTQSQGPLSLGGFYEFGILRLFGNLARQENAVGFGVFNTWWNLGLTYRNETYDNALGETTALNKSYVFLGIEI